GAAAARHVAAAPMRQAAQGPQRPRRAPAISLLAKECQALLVERQGLVIVASITSSQSEIEQRPCDAPLIAQPAVNAQSGLVARGGFFELASRSSHMPDKGGGHRFSPGVAMPAKQLKRLVAPRARLIPLA